MLGVVGAGEAADRVTDRLRADHPVTRGTAVDVLAAGPDGVVAVGDDALVGLAGAGPDVPVLPVETGPGMASVSAGDAPAAAAALAAGDVATRRHPLLAVASGDDRVGRAVFDAMLVRREPGRISEYGVTADSRLARFRADGVVVATPAGSHGYANAAGGPRLAPGADAVAVVPVAPFALGATAWVIDPAAGVELAVERDEGAVSLLLDGREARVLSGRATVSLRSDGDVELVVPPTA